MKAAYIRQPGPPETIEYGDLPQPTAGRGQVLVRVEAVAVNPIDTYVRGGFVPMTLPQPFIIGSDLAGVVEEVGPDCQRFRKGDRVWGSNQGLLGRQGTFAEFVAADEAFLYAAPDGVDSKTLAALALVGITAGLGLTRDAKLRPGEIVFVNGGTGGVGSTVVQMAKAKGARAVATARTPQKAAQCRELGAELAINYNTEDVAAKLKEFAPHGIDVWFETLRDPSFDLAIGQLARGGRMIIIAGRESRPEFPLGPFYLKGCSMHGFAMFNETPEDQRAAAEEVGRLVAAGKMKAKIDRVLKLSEAALAHRLQEENTLKKSGALAGKLVLVP